MAPTAPCAPLIDEYPESAEARTAAGLTIVQARELLDRLEACGIQAQDVHLDDKGLMCVSWSC